MFIKLMTSESDAMVFTDVFFITYNEKLQTVPLPDDDDVSCIKYYMSKALGYLRYELAERFIGELTFFPKRKGARHTDFCIRGTGPMTYIEFHNNLGTYAILTQLPAYLCTDDGKTNTVINKK